MGGHHVYDPFPDEHSHQARASFGLKDSPQAADIGQVSPRCYGGARQIEDDQEGHRDESLYDPGQPEPFPSPAQDDHESDTYYPARYPHKESKGG